MGGNRIQVNASTTPTANNRQEDQHTDRERTTSVTTDGADSSKESVEFVYTRHLKEHGILNEDALPHFLSLLSNPSTQAQEFTFIKGKVLEDHLKEFDSGGGFFLILAEGMVFSNNLVTVLGKLFKEHVKISRSKSPWCKILEAFHSYLATLLVCGASKKLLSYLDTVGDDSRLEVLDNPLRLTKKEVELIFGNALGDQRVKLEVLLSQLSKQYRRKLEKDDLVNENFRQKADNARLMKDKIIDCHNRFTEQALEQDLTISPEALYQLQCYLLILHHSFGTIQDYLNLNRPGTGTEYFLKIGFSCKKPSQRKQYLKLLLKAKSVLGGLSNAEQFFKEETTLSDGLSPERCSLAIEIALQKLGKIKGKDGSSFEEPQSSTSRNVVLAAAKLQLPSSSGSADAGNNDKVGYFPDVESLEIVDQAKSSKKKRNRKKKRNKKEIKKNGKETKLDSEGSDGTSFFPSTEPFQALQGKSAGTGSRNQSRNTKKENKRAEKEIKLSFDDAGEDAVSLSRDPFKSLPRYLSETGSKSNFKNSAQDRGEGSSSQVQQHSRNASSTEQARKRSRSSVSTWLLGIRNRTNSQDQNEKNPDSSNESIKPQRSRPKLSLDDSLEQSDRLHSDK